MGNKTTDTDTKDWSKEIIKFYNSEEYQKLNEYYNRSTIFEVLGIQRNETRHSKFLKWLLDPTSNHQLGDVPMRKFLRLLCKSEKLNEELKTKFLSNKYMISDCIIETEKCLNQQKNKKCLKQQKDKSGRVDLFLLLKIGDNDNDNDVAIVVENKINAAEEQIPVSKINDEDAKKYFDKISDENGEIGQTVFYQYWMDKNWEKTNKIFVYLTPDGSNCKSEDYIKITYQNIVDYVIDPIMLMNLTTETRFFIKEYLRTLSILAADEEENSEKKTLKSIIATSKNETSYLKKIGEDSDIKPLIEAAYKNRGNDGAEGWEEKCLKDFWDKNKTLLASILKETDEMKYQEITNEKSQNPTIIIYNGRHYNHNSEFVWQVVSDYVKSEKIKDIKDLKAKFKEKENGCYTTQMFATKDEFNSYQYKKASNYWSRKEPINLNGNSDVYVTSVWRVFENNTRQPNHNLKRFIGILKDLNFDVIDYDNMITVTTKKGITE